MNQNPLENRKESSGAEVETKNVADIESLNEAEEAELGADLKLLFEFPYGPENGQISWRIVEKFGERAIPYILKNLDKGMNTYYTVGKFLDTLVTDKTAPLVLQAIQEKKIGIAYGALAAAKGKEKTVKGIESLLINYEIQPMNRGDFCKMLEALGETGVDSASLSIAQFYEKLCANKEYAAVAKKHLEQSGTNLHAVDAYDVVRALGKLGGIKSQKLLEHFAKDGDEHIRNYAKKFLSGELYLGKPLKWIIENPANKMEYYCTESDVDLEDDSWDEWGKDLSQYNYDDPDIEDNFQEELDSSDMLEDETEYPPLPESLGTQGEWTRLVDPETVNGEEVSTKLMEYLRGQDNAFELLGSIRPFDQDYPNMAEYFQKRDRSDTLTTALCLEALRSILRVPNYKSLREAVDELNDFAITWNNKGEDEEVAKNAGRLSKITTDFSLGVEGIRQEDMRLPESALPFKLWHEGMQRSRDIQPFTDLLRKKLEPYFAEQALRLVTGRSNTNIIRDLLRRTVKLFSLYREISDTDVPLYKNASDRLRKIGRDKDKIFYGRDADYFYYAIKALQFGQKGEVKPKKIYINTMLKNVLEDSSGKDLELRDRIIAYLLQEKVPADALHIDSGFSGSVPEAVIRALDPDLNEDEINERIKLLSSHRMDREEISGRDEGTIISVESRSKHYGTITGIVRDEKNGKLRVVYNKPDPWREIEAWVIDQAVIRHFAPKNNT